MLFLLVKFFIKLRCINLFKFLSYLRERAGKSNAERDGKFSSAQTKKKNHRFQ